MPRLRKVGRTPKLPKRKPDTHKGTYGRVLIVAGSRGMAGAAVLAARGALRAGAGLVYLCAPDRIYDALASQLVCAVIHPMPTGMRGALSMIRGLSAQCQVAAIGPGLGTGRKTVGLLHKLLPSLTIPLVLDADALNVAARDVSLLRSIRAPKVLTPHPGELGRLLKRKTATLQRNRAAAAAEAALAFRAVVVLKGHRTVVTDGARLYVNRTGNPGMATGGTGDVLTGIVAALIGQHMKPFEAACLGVRLHGMAGDLAARDKGQVSLIASDLPEYLPTAIRRG